MPVAVRFIPTKGRETGNYAIVEVASGRIVGRSNTRQNAESSARIRNAAYYKKKARAYFRKVHKKT